jgi:menaquinone-specific isochorismate synthase
MNITEKFGFFDPTQDYTVTYGRLPHWEQEGATYFITFRTADSIPARLMQLWLREREDWLRRHNVNPNRTDWYVAFAELPEDKQYEFHRQFVAKLERHLDACHGKCLLKQPNLARIVADSLTHFDAQRYWLGDFVVMPNHVHLLACFLPGIRLRKQCYSWKHYTSGKINKAIGCRGEYWQKESFDHLVRDADQLQRFRAYIADNPRKANLKEGEYYHYISPYLPPLQV